MSAGPGGRSIGAVVAICLVGVVLLTGTVIAGVAATAPADGNAGGDDADPAAGSPPTLFGTAPPVSGYDALAVRTRIGPDGTAHWTVNFRFRLTDAAAERAFERAARNVTNPPGKFITLMKTSGVARAEARTGRSMRLQNGSVATRRSVPDGRFGIITYRFEWTNFAAQPADDRVVVGDALAGYRLSDNESLMIEWERGLRRETITPPPDANQSTAVRWTGPLQFPSAGPTVELAVTDAATSGLGVPVPVPAAAAVAGLVALAAAGGWYRYQAGASVATLDDDAAELLSDEERVLRLLEANDGRMKQQDLLEAVEWSRTKTSEVVNEMHEAGQIEVFRLGRENVLALPGEIDL